MFVDLGAFYNEKEAYNQRVIDIKAKVADPNLLARQLEEERLKFKGITRKYLAPALAVIKETFGVDYSLYKIGRDVDANFKTIETTIHKTQTEIANDMNQLVEKANAMNLDEYKSNRINIAIDVVMSYVDDVAIVEDENKSFFLNHTKVVASTVNMPVTKKEDLPQNQPVSEPVYNPYANQPINFNEQQSTAASVQAKEPLVDPFAGIYGGAAVAAATVATPVEAAQPNPNTIPSVSFQPPQMDALHNFSTNQMIEPANNLNNNPTNRFVQEPMDNLVGDTSNNPTSVFGEQARFIQQSNEPFGTNIVEQTVSAPQQVQTTPQFIQQPQAFNQPQQFIQQPVQVQQAPQFIQPAVQNNAAVAAVTPVIAAPQIVMPETPLANSSNNNVSASKIADGRFIGTEKIAIAMQLLATILIPVLVFISSAIIYFIFGLDVVSEFAANMPEAITWFARCLIIITICLILCGPIISLGKRVTGYLERFLIAPALLSIPTAYFSFQLISKLELESMEVAFHVGAISIFAFVIYFVFVTLMFFRGFVNSNNNPNVKAPKWTVFDFLGMLLVVYTIMIPAVYLTCGIIDVQVDILDKIVETIYFTNNPDISQYMDKVFLVVAPITAALGMILRTVIIFIKGRKKA